MQLFCFDGHGGVLLKRRLECLLILSLLLGACDGSQRPSTTGTQPGAATQEVLVFFGVAGSTECDEVEAYLRLIPGDADPVRGAFDALLAGPLEEETAATSWFSDDTAGAVLSTDLVDGVLTVDMADLSGVIPNAFQFEAVEEVTFLFEGSCDRLFMFLQMECSPAIR
jgi:hypothetical protein